MENSLFNNLAKRLATSIPASVETLQDDLKAGSKSLLEAKLAQLNLVTRAEFDIQQAVLQRSRQKITNLETQIKQLELQISTLIKP